MKKKIIVLIIIFVFIVLLILGILYFNYTLEVTSIKVINFNNETNELTIEIAKKDKVANKFMEELNKINKDYVFREYMTKEEDDEKMLNTLVSRAKKEGLEQGIEQNKKEFINKLISKNYTIKQISELLDITEDEIEKILKQ